MKIENLFPVKLFQKTALLLMFLLMTSMTYAEDWPQWRGPDRNGISSETIQNTNWKSNSPKLLWTKEGFGTGYASVSIFDGKLYTTGNLDNGQSVIAADAETGKIIWTKPFKVNYKDHNKFKGSRSTPTVDGDYLYVISYNGSIACLDRHTGDVKWSKDFDEEWNGKMMSGWGYSESALVDGDHVLCTPGGQNAMIVKLDKRTGKTVWKAKMPRASFEKGKDGAGYSSIVVSNAGGVKQYVQMTGRGLFSVRASDGGFLWGYNRVANKTANIPTPIVDGDYVFGSTGYGTGACLVHVKSAGKDKVKIDEVYFLEASTFENHHGGIILKDGYLYSGHKNNNGYPICLKMDSGKVQWGGSKQRGPGKGSAAIVMVGDHLIYRYQDGTVALIEATPEKYNLKGTFKPDYQKGNTWAHPVVVNGKLYLREQTKLMCYSLAQ